MSLFSSPSLNAWMRMIVLSVTSVRSIFFAAIAVSNVFAHSLRVARVFDDGGPEFLGILLPAGEELKSDG